MRGDSGGRFPYAAAMNLQAPSIRRPATYQDVLDAPAHMVAEILDGELHLQPRPRSRHGLAALSLGDELVGPFQKGRGGPGGWWLVTEPELHLGDAVMVPDLAGWRHARLPVFPDAPWFDLAPDWACEVLSPSTRRIDTTTKRDLYARHGVAHLWFDDPDARLLEAFALTPGGWCLIAALRDADTVRVAPFDAVAFPLADLWPPPEPAPA
jgi:Uma2 family endonuclease